MNFKFHNECYQIIDIKKLEVNDKHLNSLTNQKNLNKTFEKFK